MKFGVSIFVTDFSISPSDVAKAAEARGFESLFFPEHTHIPASRRSPWGGGPNLPEMYWHSLDPFVAIGAAAAVTSQIKLGTGVCLVIERDPITLAKEVASVDHISNGRFLFGIGGGWNLEEMENHGTDPAKRWRILQERILAMKQIWTQDEAEYHGRHVDFDPIWSWPKPVQKPHPPILVGGNGPHTLQRVAEYGDGWMPIGGRAEIPVVEKMAELNRLAADAGRGPIPITLTGTPLDPATIDRYRQLGVDRLTYGLPSAGPDRVIPALDQIAEVIARA
ncbi:MAG: LLM class F420-dependent oxidoreductase [Dehalococcoidia bacterium]